ncbi:DJ-1 family glyoxalase III [Ruminococcus gauvreauii]|uniref:DJ-1/PfpI family protein n=1 Tax=Ruminococcus gauvreauii TaxID=438033 RepID=A0ABY5VJV6_9FIRM|nr:DJ-1 family glyoxalase III [Ruminococcus gauvreauii]UWP60592.1 DJ-1/PfpI family protein [Ruminococcus gauvreauii]
MAKVYMFLADGFEEVEGLTVVDLLRRAEIEVVMTSIMGRQEVTGTNGITVKADRLFEDVNVSDADMLVLPGGQPGTTNLGAHKPLAELLLKWNSEGGRLAAICAAPTVFGGLGLLKGKKATCYPGCEGGLDGAHTTEERVVTDGNITTSRGVGTAIAFGLELIAILVNKETADKIKTSIVYGH